MELIPSKVQFANILVKSQTPRVFFSPKTIKYIRRLKKTASIISSSMEFVSQNVTIFKKVPFCEEIWASGG